MILPDIFGKEGVKYAIKTVNNKILGQPNPTNPYLGHLYQIKPFLPGSFIRTVWESRRYLHGSHGSAHCLRVWVHPRQVLFNQNEWKDFYRFAGLCVLKKNFVWTTWSTDWRNSGSFMTWNWLTINVSPTPWDQKKLLSPPSSLDPCRPHPSSPLNHPHLPHFQPSTSEREDQTGLTLWLRWTQPLS